MSLFSVLAAPPVTQAKVVHSFSKAGRSSDHTIAEITRKRWWRGHSHFVFQPSTTCYHQAKLHRLYICAQASAGVPGGKDLQRVLVLGGSGRIGSEVARYLLRRSAGAWTNQALQIELGARDPKRGAAVAADMAQSFPDAVPPTFLVVDAFDEESLERALEGVDLVIHTAGPFQQLEDTLVLKVALDMGVNYLDICDDAPYGKAASELHTAARKLNVSAVTTGGIFPGVSNLMASESIARLRAPGKEPREVRFYYYVAGTGGAGPTVLASTFLLGSIPVEVYINNAVSVFPPISNRRSVDFGPRIGRRATYLYELPEVGSIHRCLGIPTVSARFGTAPELWNLATRALAAFVPRSILADRELIRAFVVFIDPVIRKVDELVGADTAMRVDVVWSDGSRSRSLYTSNDVAKAAARATAAMAVEILSGHVAPGVWYPETAFVGPSARRVLSRASEESTLEFEVPYLK